MRPRGNPWLAVVLSWLLPGLGHAYLGRWRRGLAFAGLMAVLLYGGILLRGPLWAYPLPFAGELSLRSEMLSLPLVILGLTGYEGQVTARGYEYGMTFLLTVSLFTLLLMLDAWEISKGHKP